MRSLLTRGREINDNKEKGKNSIGRKQVFEITNAEKEENRREKMNMRKGLLIDKKKEQKVAKRCHQEKEGIAHQVHF